MKNKREWSWPVSGYLFLGGMGGGMIVVSSAADLFWESGELFSLGSLAAGVIIALSSGLLILDLGRPLQFWRVLSRQKAIMTVGSWMLAVSIITSLFYFSFWPGSSPWADLIGLRHGFAWINLILGLGVCLYTGILLGSMKARPFWNTPALPILFLVSGLSTGIAGQSLLIGIWPYSGTVEPETALTLLKHLDIGFIITESVIIFAYIIIMHSSSGEETKRMASSWLKGTKKFAFWGGLFGLGLLLPVVLYSTADEGIGLTLALAAVLFGGLILRLLIVYSDERKKLPDEV